MLISRSDKPILTLNQPWERGGTACAVGAFLEDDQRSIRLYYLVYFENDMRRNVLCMARTADLRTWEKPDCGDGTNVVMRSCGNTMGWGIFMPSRILQGCDDPDVNRQWKMLYWERPDTKRPPGYCLATSPDGLRWTPLFDQPVITGANDAGSMIDARDDVPSPVENVTMLIYQQTWKYNPQLPRDRDNLTAMHRMISIWRASSIHGSWTGPIAILEPDRLDPPDVQFYWLTPFRAGRGYAGFLHTHHTAEQIMDAQLVTSLDGWTWRRENDRRPVLSLGQKGRFDCGMIMSWAAPVAWNGRVLVFYNASATVHDGKPRYPNDPLPAPAEGIGLAEFDQDLLKGPE